jgi:pyruvate ferredoxin oxidoreductase beta subunit
VQRSSLTPFAADTRTSPRGRVGFGNQTRKKDLPAIIAAHHIPYVATATIGFYQDLERKVKKAMTITGPKYIQIHVPCPLGWAYPSEQTIKIAKLAVNCGLVPIYEMENGVITNVRKISKKVAVTEYLQPQGRFRHLFQPGREKELADIQAIADANISQYGLM